MLFIRGLGSVREGSPSYEIFDQDIPGKCGVGSGKESGGVWKD